MKSILTTCAAVVLVGCASFYESIGVEPSKPQGNAPIAGASIGVMYYAPAWGPDTNGEEVVYFLKQVTLSSRDDEQGRIYFCSVKPDGSERREIAQLWKDNPDQYFENFAVAVTMDVNATTKRAAIGVELGERGGIFTVNLDGTGFLSLLPKVWKGDRPTKAGYPTWSPDGQWLAFHEHRFEGGRYLYRIVKCKPDDTAYMSLTERNEINYQPAWSPTDDLIAYVSHKEQHLYLMKPDGSQKRDTKVWGKHPRWSPDGKFISFSSTVFDVAEGKPVTGKPTKVWNRAHLVFPKWGKSGLVSVGPQDISFASTERDLTSRLLRNVSRQGNMSDMEKEQFRW